MKWWRLSWQYTVCPGQDHKLGSIGLSWDTTWWKSVVLVLYCTTNAGLNAPKQKRRRCLSFLNAWDTDHHVIRAETDTSVHAESPANAAIYSFPSCVQHRVSLSGGTSHIFKSFTFIICYDYLSTPKSQETQRYVLVELQGCAEAPSGPCGSLFICYFWC